MAPADTEAPAVSHAAPQAHLPFREKPYEPAPAVEQEAELSAWPPANSQACWARAQASALPSVRGSYRSLEPESSHRFLAAAASAVPVRPLKALEATRSPAKAPGPEPQSAW